MTHTPEFTLPSYTRERRNNSRIVYTTLALTVLGLFLGVICQIIAASNPGLGALPSYVLTSFLLFPIAGICFSLGVKIRRVLRRDDTELYSLDDWVQARYGLLLTYRQLRRLSRDAIQNKRGSFMSRNIRILANRAGDDSFYRVNYMLTNHEGPWMLYSPEYEAEAIDREEKLRTISLREFCYEAGASGDHQIYAYEIDGEIAQHTSLEHGTVALFWSDQLRVELYLAGREANIISATLEQWYEDILPEVAKQGMRVGLNWQDEQPVLTTSEIVDLLGK